MDEKQLQSEFLKAFGTGTEPVKAYFAPGRVNMIGEHTDYNGGHVFPCALTLGIYGAFRRRQDRQLRFYSLSYPQAGIITASLDRLINSEQGGWSNYPMGVIWTLDKKAGIQLPGGFDMLVYSHLPVGCGLSSSAALEVMTGLALSDLFGLHRSLKDIALDGQFCENHFINLNCGIMDQFISALGRKDNAMFLDTNTLDYEYAPLAMPDAKIIITNSNVKHSLASSAYNQRRQQCETALAQLQTVLPVKTLGDLDEDSFETHKKVITDPVCLRRARHAVYENRRTIKAFSLLKSGDIAGFGRLMNQSHVSLRDDYEVSCKELDYLAELAWMHPGVIGCRMTGGGFGGCTVAIVENEHVESFIAQLGAKYKGRFGIIAEFYIVEPGDGARAIM